MIYQTVVLVCVAALWGGTNPLLKQNTRDINKVKAKNSVIKFLLEAKYLATNIQYLIPMALNQLGSVVYFISLQSTELSLAVPLTNSLTFVFTSISGWLLGEQLPRKKTVLGIILILAGTSLCCYDKWKIKQ